MTTSTAPTGVVAHEAAAETAAAPVRTTSIKTNPLPAAEAPTAAGTAGSAVFALIFVVGLILLLGRLLKKLPGAGFSSGREDLRLVGSLALGPKDRVVVVEVSGKQLLLGIGGTAGPRLLHTLEQPLPEAETAPAPFAQILARQFRRKP